MGNKEKIKSVDKLVQERCGQCENVLNIPYDLHHKILQLQHDYEQRKDSDLVGTGYEGFYVSPGAYFYCSSHCFTMFTED